ncbi:hypothetical protein C8J56DRAFT_1054517 [Mycena floridula]|nr:hypothetical protein C8J56DRAFT_1054517 [Mycena floridula]
MVRLSLAPPPPYYSTYQSIMTVLPQLSHSPPLKRLFQIDGLDCRALPQLRSTAIASTQDDSDKFLQSSRTIIAEPDAITINCSTRLWLALTVAHYFQEHIPDPLGFSYASGSPAPYTTIPLGPDCPSNASQLTLLASYSPGAPPAFTPNDRAVALDSNTSYQLFPTLKMISSDGRPQLRPLDSVALDDLCSTLDYSPQIQWLTARSISSMVGLDSVHPDHYISDPKRSPSAVPHRSDHNGSGVSCFGRLMPTISLEPSLAPPPSHSFKAVHFDYILDTLYQSFTSAEIISLYIFGGPSRPYSSDSVALHR